MQSKILQRMSFCNNVLSQFYSYSKPLHKLKADVLNLKQYVKALVLHVDTSV